jgi:hypothetical protein
MASMLPVNYELCGPGLGSVLTVGKKSNAICWPSHVAACDEPWNPLRKLVMSSFLYSKNTCLERAAAHLSCSLRLVV